MKPTFLNKSLALGIASAVAFVCSQTAVASNDMQGWHLPGDTPEKLADPLATREAITALREQDLWTEHATPEQIALFDGPETEWPQLPMTAYDLEGVNTAWIGSEVPAPGLHPRILFSPEDVPAIRARLMGTEDWVATEVQLQRSLLDPESDDGKVFKKLATGDLEGLEFPDDGNRGSNGRHVFKGYGKPGIYAAHVPYWPRNLNAIGFYALITGDDALGQKAANAVVNYYKLREPLIDLQNARAEDPNAEDAWPFDVWRGMHWVAGEGHLGFAYDMTAMHMNAEQREFMRQIIVKATGGKRAYAANGPVRWRDTNWVGWDTQHVLTHLAIEGLEGYEPELLEGLRDTVYGYLTYGISPYGTIFETNGKNSAGFQYAMNSLVAVARRGNQHFLGHPHLRKLASSQIHQVPPAGGHNFNNGTYGGAFFKEGGFLKNLFPEDKTTDWLLLQGQPKPEEKDLATYREELENMHSLYRFTPLTATNFLRQASFEGVEGKETWERDYLNLPLDFEDPHHGQLTTRSGNHKDALYLMTEARPDLYTGGHQHYDAGGFYLSAYGVNWGVEGNNGIRSSRFHSVVLIDGEGQGDNGHFSPARADWLGAVKNDHAAFARMDQKHAYDYIWTLAPHYSWEKDSRKALDWEPETHPEVVKVFKGTQQAKTRIWSDSYWKSNWGPTMRHANNPVEKAFRSAGIVRGEHPYALIVDDIRKDDQVRVYDWQMQLPDGVTTTSWWKMPEGLIVLARAEDMGKREPNKGAPCLAVLVLEMRSDFKGDARVAFPPEIREQLITNTKRLVISTKAVEPDFKIALVPFRFGEPIPSAEMEDGKATITWASTDNRSKETTIQQQDEIHFNERADGRTGFSIQRDGKQLIRVD